MIKNEIISTFLFPFWENNTSPSSDFFTYNRTWPWTRKNRTRAVMFFFYFFAVWWRTSCIMGFFNNSACMKNIVKIEFTFKHLNDKVKFLLPDSFSGLVNIDKISLASLALHSQVVWKDHCQHETYSGSKMKLANLSRIFRRIL